MNEVNGYLKDSVVLITGGTGTFGKSFLDRCIKEEAKEIRILSRDEKKQYEMAQEYRRNESVKFFLGDIRDKKTVDVPMYGVDYVFHAAAMKQVPSCEQFPMEAVKTNILGSENVFISAAQKRVKKVVVLSTDKAVFPTSAMGLSKAYMEKIALEKARIYTGTKFCITRFGNLLASRGSVVPLFISQVESGSPITITEENMTRFIMTLDEADDLVMEAFKNGESGDLFVKKSKACTTKDLADAVLKYLGKEDYPIKKIGMRPGEKLHESLLSYDEFRKSEEKDGYLIVKNDADVRNSSGIEHGFDSYLTNNKFTVQEIVNLIRKVFEEDEK